MRTKEGPASQALRRMRCGRATRRRERPPASRPQRALAAGVSIFELARLMGTSVAMIDRTYGHLARDSEDAIRARLEARLDRSGDEMVSASPD